VLPNDSILLFLVYYFLLCFAIFTISHYFNFYIANTQR
jgi:hypothetical protein